MRKIFLFILITFFATNIFGQSPMPNATVPILLPPPIPASKTKEEKTKNIDCTEPQKLLQFTLPCCLQTDSAVPVTTIANLQFDSSGCIRGTVHFDPEFIMPSQKNESQNITATYGQQIFTAKIVAMANVLSHEARSFTFSFEKEAESFKRLMEQMKNGAVPVCEATGNTLPKGNLQYVSTLSCCNRGDSCVHENKNFSGNYLWDFGVSCHMPLYGIPYVPAFDAVLVGMTSIKATIADSTNCVHTQSCLNLEGDISFGGKGARNLPPGILQAEIKLQSIADYFKNDCSGEGKSEQFKPPVLKASGSILSGWGLISHTFDYNIYKPIEKSQ